MMDHANDNPKEGRVGGVTMFRPRPQGPTVEQVLHAAIEYGLDQVFVLGYAEDGEFYSAINFDDGGEALWLLELAKKRIMENADG